MKCPAYCAGSLTRSLKGNPKMMQINKLMAIGLVAASLLGTAGLVAAEDNPHEMREKAMKAMGGSMKAIKDIVGADGPAADIVAPAQKIAEMQAMQRTLQDLARHCHGDHRPLAHAAAELVRVLMHAALRSGDTHLLQHLDGLRQRIAFAQALVQDDGLGNLVADGEDRV